MPFTPAPMTYRTMVVELVDAESALVAVGGGPRSVHVAAAALHGIVQAAQLSLRVTIVRLLVDPHDARVGASGGREHTMVNTHQTELCN